MDWGISNQKSSIKRGLLITMIIIIFFIISIFYLTPTVISVWNGEKIDNLFPFTTIKINEENGAISVDAPTNENHNSKGKSFQTQEIKGTVNLFGFIPIKEVTVNIVPKIELSPCGMASGIKMLTDGVMVVGMDDVETSNGKINPAKEAGICLKDIIISVNGNKLKNIEQLSGLIKQEGKKAIIFEIRRNEKNLRLIIRPVKSIDKGYKIGLWVRDSAAGIGTVTYIDHNREVFGGLGHAICDVDTDEIMSVGEGTLTRAIITQIKKGKKGEPGELRGYFDDDMPIGTLIDNNSSGVFGILDKSMNNDFTTKLPIALKNEITIGKATILANINSDIIEEFDIEIVKINSGSNDERNMIIKITDENLLNRTGGIVQGMSGSPILQNGKIIGAVTHVLVNDPTKGYGIFIENMLKNTFKS